MSVGNELNRLNAIIGANESTPDQIQAANEAIQKLTTQMMNDALSRLEQNSALYANIVSKLQNVISDIQANRFSQAMDTVNDVVADATSSQ